MLDSLTTLALSRLVKESAEKAARAQVQPGEYPVDLTVHVSGTMTVAPDQTYQPTSSIPWKKALALAIHYSGATGPAALAVLERAMVEAVNGGAPALSDKDIEAAEARVLATLAALPAKSRKGPAALTATVEVVHAQDHALAAK